MKRTLLLACLWLSYPSFAILQIGDLVPNKCYANVEGTETCLRGSQGTVRVLLFNAGWCGPCNEEFDQLSTRVKEFDGKPVTFISLSASGWTQAEAPTQTFLKEWKDKHKVSFEVCASPKDAGKQFFEPPLYIPSVVILDGFGNLTYAEVNPGINAMFAEVKRLLSLMGGGL